MKLLLINSIKADIDSKTNIGINFQNYDINDPSNRKISYSNSFTLPITENNNVIFGFAKDAQSFGMEVYDKLNIEYWQDNEKLIEGKCIITEISDRIKLTIFQKNEFWDELKAYTYTEFITDFLAWLNTEKNVPIFTDQFAGTLQDLMDIYANNTEGIIIPYMFGNLFMQDDGSGAFVEDEDNIHVWYQGGNGGHVCCFVKTIFEFLEEKFDVDFNLNTTDAGNIWNDVYAPNIYIPLRRLAIDFAGPGESNFFFKITVISTAPSLISYPPYNILDYAEKTMYDFLKSFIQLFNLVVLEDNSLTKLSISMKRFDDILTYGKVVKFSGKIDLRKTVFKPSFSGIAQINKIKYGVKFEGATEDEGDLLITSENKNLEPKKELFDFDSYYPNVIINSDNESIINLSTEESFETFTFLISAGLSYTTKFVKFFTFTATLKLRIAQLYSITGEYNLLKTIYEYPKFYTIEKWLTINDVIALDFYKIYYIKELRGGFFINKISGFNPDDNKKPTKIDLIKVGETPPLPIGESYDVDVFVDGNGNPFVDGSNNFFI